MATPADHPRSAQDQVLLARFKLLTEQTLPAMARERRWPIHFDHCFKRICLDHAFGGVWYDHLRRPAERHLEGEPLRRAAGCAEDILSGGLDVLRERDAASLRFRGKAPKRERSCALPFVPEDTF